MSTQYYEHPQTGKRYTIIASDEAANTLRLKGDHAEFDEPNDPAHFERMGYVLREGDPAADAPLTTPSTVSIPGMLPPNADGTLPANAAMTPKVPDAPPPAPSAPPPPVPAASPSASLETPDVPDAPPAPTAAPAAPPPPPPAVPPAPLAPPPPPPTGAVPPPPPPPIPGA